MPKKSADSRNFATRGVSFPKKPFNLIGWIEEAAARENRNFSNYIVGLILREKARLEEAAND